MLVSGIQGISPLLPGGIHLPQYVHLPSLGTGIKGKYHLSELNSLIVNLGGVKGCQGGYI